MDLHKASIWSILCLLPAILLYGLISMECFHWIFDSHYGKSLDKAYQTFVIQFFWITTESNQLEQVTSDLTQENKVSLQLSTRCFVRYQPFSNHTPSKVDCTVNLIEFKMDLSCYDSRPITVTNGPSSSCNRPTREIDNVFTNCPRYAVSFSSFSVSYYVLFQIITRPNNGSVKYTTCFVVNLMCHFKSVMKQPDALIWYHSNLEQWGKLEWQRNFYGSIAKTINCTEHQLWMTCFTSISKVPPYILLSSMRAHGQYNIFHTQPTISAVEWYFLFARANFKLHVTKTLTLNLQRF